MKKKRKAWQEFNFFQRMFGEYGFGCIPSLLCMYLAFKLTIWFMTKILKLL